MVTRFLDTGSFPGSNAENGAEAGGSDGLLMVGRGSQDVPFCSAYAVPSPPNDFDIFGPATHLVAGS
jgi:hypothetical protein